MTKRILPFTFGLNQKSHGFSESITWIELFIDGNLPLISSDSAVVSQVILKDHPWKVDFSYLSQKQ